MYLRAAGKYLGGNRPAALIIRASTDGHGPDCKGRDRKRERTHKQVVITAGTRMEKTTGRSGSGKRSGTDETGKDMAVIREDRMTGKAVNIPSGSIPGKEFKGGGTVKIKNYIWKTVRKY